MDTVVINGKTYTLGGSGDSLLLAHEWRDCPDALKETASNFVEDTALPDFVSLYDFCTDLEGLKAEIQEDNPTSHVEVYPLKFLTTEMWDLIPQNQKLFSANMFTMVLLWDK